MKVFLTSILVVTVASASVAADATPQANNEALHKCRKIDSLPPFCAEQVLTESQFDAVSKLIDANENLSNALQNNMKVMEELKPKQ